MVRWGLWGTLAVALAGCAEPGSQLRSLATLDDALLEVSCADVGCTEAEVSLVSPHPDRCAFGEELELSVNRLAPVRPVGSGELTFVEECAADGLPLGATCTERRRCEAARFRISVTGPSLSVELSQGGGARAEALFAQPLPRGEAHWVAPAASALVVGDQIELMWKGDGAIRSGALELVRSNGSDPSHWPLSSGDGRRARAVIGRDLGQGSGELRISLLIAQPASLCEGLGACAAVRQVRLVRTFDFRGD